MEIHKFLFTEMVLASPYEDNYQIFTPELSWELQIFIMMQSAFKCVYS